MSASRAPFARKIRHHGRPRRRVIRPRYKQGLAGPHNFTDWHV